MQEKDKYNELIYDRLFNNCPEETDKFFDNEVDDQWLNYSYGRKTDGIYIKLKDGTLLHYDLVEVQ